MGSSLKSKLNRLREAAPPPPERPAPALMEYEESFPLDKRLFSLSPGALARMDFSTPFHPRRALFLDTETTGLSGGAGTVAFLVGLGRVEGNAFVVRQYLMSSYAAEPMLLEKVIAAARECDTLVTFNGKTFDVPLLASRCVLGRVPCPLQEMAHLDLIHPARRAWKLRLKDCSLGNLEERILGAPREDDLPGSEVPQRYFAFLKTGDMRLLDDILRHNRQDIATLAALLTRLEEVYAEPDRQTSMLDVFSLGKALEKRGEGGEARKCYRLAAHARPLDALSLRESRCAPLANRRLSLLLKRTGDQAEAEAVWREMIRREQMGAFPYIELAKAREHRDRRPDEALDFARRALPLAEDDAQRQAIEKRIARLNRRLSTKKQTREDNNHGTV